jgi:hypothetical protein
MVAIGLNVVRLHLDVVGAANAALPFIATYDQLRPSGVTGYPMLAARVSVPVCIVWSEVPQAALIGASLGAKLLAPKH